MTRIALLACTISLSTACGSSFDREQFEDALRATVAVREEIRANAGLGPAIDGSVSV